MSMTESQAADEPVLVAALGASAGGLEALEDFFDHMQPDTGVSFLVAQHLDPNRESIGPDLLGQHTSMPVRQAVDGDILRPDHVYVAPPDAWMTLGQGTLHMEPRQGRGSPTVVDRLFRSMAADAGPAAVAILLSGAGSDGAIGIGWVREAGGLAMVQDPATARFDSMPRHGITIGRVADILPPAGLAARVAEYAEQVRRGESETSTGSYGDSGAAIERIVTLLLGSTGHDFSLYKPATLLRRVARRAKRRSCAGLDQYAELLEDDPREIQVLFEDLLIGVTSFFRDPEAFDTIRRQVIPRIVDERDAGGSIRVWVAGCGTGQEAYSLAMLFREALADRTEAPALKIFATDANENALAVARRGHYPQGIVEEVPADLMKRYFRSEESEKRVTEELREACIFARHDLLSDPPFSSLDLISCRNVLIYLRQEAQDRLLPLFHYALKPGGTLFLGSSEGVTGHARLFREIQDGHHLFQRRDTAVRLPQAFPGHRIASRPGTSRLPAGGQPGPRPERTSARATYTEELEHLLLSKYTPPCVIVDEDRTIIYIHGRTGEFLEPSPGRPSDDLMAMARVGLRPQLRSAMVEAVRTKETVMREGVSLGARGSWDRVDLTVHPLRESHGAGDLYLVLFQKRAGWEVRREAGEAGEATAGPEGDGADTDRIIEELERELTETRRQLLASLREQESANEELRAANEELTSMNEELQSSNEELQTADEETQSVNEELETVNTELNQRVLELKQALSDLDNLFASNEIATIFLNRQLRIQRFTPAATSIFRLQEADIGRPLSDITSRIVAYGDDMANEVAGVLDTLEPLQREIRVDHEGAWYDMRIHPYRTIDDEMEGVVLTFVDITEIKRLEQVRSRLGAIVEGMHDAVVGHDLNGLITSWNEAARHLFGYDPEEAIGRDLSLIVPADHTHEVDAALAEVLRGGWTSPVETVLKTREDQRVHVSINLSPIRDHAGRVVEIAQTARDISARVEAEQTARDADLRKNEFLTMLGHELRNPLGTIRNSVEFLARRAATVPELDEEDREPLDVLVRQVGYMANLVNDLTDAARMSNGRFDLHEERMDLAAIVREGLADYRGWAEDLGVTLEGQVPDEALWIEGDRTRLAQVLGNLIQNACKYSLEKGVVSVAIRREERWALVSVRDRGPGLEADEIERIFDLFDRGSRSLDASSGPGGLGVGLPVARRLVELHGGSLWAASPGRGQGSTFTFRVPLADEHASTTSRPGPDAGAAPSPRRVLVVEDDRDAADSMRRLLVLMGHEVRVAYTADAARQLILDEPPDVVLCDIHLSGELDGYELARALRGEPRSAAVRLVALTGFGRDIDREQAREAGFDQHLTKPVTADDLERALGGRESAD
jgi:two-component system CheB/CheR fusion protein